MNGNSRRELDSSTIREIRIKRNRIRRARQLRRRIVIGIAALIIIVCSSLGMTSFLSKAAAEPDDYKIKTYTSVMVPYGCTLNDLALDYIDYDYYESLDSYISEVRFINHLSDNDDRIRPGFYLILPDYLEDTDI